MQRVEQEVAEISRLLNQANAGAASAHTPTLRADPAARSTGRPPSPGRRCAGSVVLCPHSAPLLRGALGVRLQATCGVESRFLIGVLVVACVASACTGGGDSTVAPTSTTHPSRPTSTAAPIVLPAVTPEPSDCAFNPANEAFTGADGTASAIGWAGNSHGVVTCLGGRFYVQAPFNRAFGFGIYAGTPTKWEAADGYLPAEITSFHREGVAVVITEFADRVVLGGHPFVARVQPGEGDESDEWRRHR